MIHEKDIPLLRNRGVKWQAVARSTTPAHQGEAAVIYFLTADYREVAYYFPDLYAMRCLHDGRMRHWAPPMRDRYEWTDVSADLACQYAGLNCTERFDGPDCDGKDCGRSDCFSCHACNHCLSE